MILETSWRSEAGWVGNFPQAFTHLALINAVMHVIETEEMTRDRGRPRAATPALLAASRRMRGQAGWPPPRVRLTAGAGELHLQGGSLDAAACVSTESTRPQVRQQTRRPGPPGPVYSATVVGVRQRGHVSARVSAAGTAESSSPMSAMTAPERRWAAGVRSAGARHRYPVLRVQSTDSEPPDDIVMVIRWTAWLPWPPARG
jgi:hypothetical protein